jgi:uncharacterized membrane protein
MAKVRQLKGETVISHSIEIDRRPEDVFAYVNAVDRHREWQNDIISSKIETDGPVGVGTKLLEVRKAGGFKQEIRYEITEHEPPRRTAFKGIDGPIRATGSVTVEPAGDGSKSRVTVGLDLRGRGLIGFLLGPLARWQARQRVPLRQAALKARLEAGV